MTFVTLVGLCGDVFTFLGGGVLAWDATQREKDFKRLREKTRIFHSAFSKLVVEERGILLKDEKDVEQVIIHQSVRVARVGFVLLWIGFIGLLASRILEVAEK